MCAMTQIRPCSFLHLHQLNTSISAFCVSSISPPGKRPILSPRAAAATGFKSSRPRLKSHVPKADTLRLGTLKHVSES